MNHPIEIKVANYQPFTANLVVADDVVMCGDALLRGASEIANVSRRFGYTEWMGELICYCINEGYEYTGEHSSELGGPSFSWRILDAELYKLDCRE